MKDFNATVTAFDARNASWLGKAADLAYKTEQDVRSTLAQWQMRGEFVSVCRPPDCDTQAIVAASPTLMVVAYRGTKDYLDFLTDAEFLQTPFVGKTGAHGKVHVGFLKALDGSWTEVRRQITALRDKNQPIWLTGHSLGAALATLAAARLCDEGVPVAGLYTAGSPTVGDPTFADWFDRVMQGRAWRYVNDLDLVTRCPPEGVPVLPSYKHVGRRMHFGADGALTDDSDWLRWGSVAMAMVEIWRRSKAAGMTRAQLKAEIALHAGEPLADHSMDGYVRNLDAALQPRSAAGGTTSGGGLLGSLESAFKRYKPHWFK